MSPALRIEGGVIIGIVPDRGKEYGAVEGRRVIVTGRWGGFEVKLDVPHRPTFYGPGESLRLDSGVILESISEAGLKRLKFPEHFATGSSV